MGQMHTVIWLFQWRLVAYVSVCESVTRCARTTKCLLKDRTRELVLDNICVMSHDCVTSQSRHNATRMRRLCGSIARSLRCIRKLGLSQSAFPVTSLPYMFLTRSEYGAGKF